MPRYPNADAGAPRNTAPSAAAAAYPPRISAAASALPRAAPPAARPPSPYVSFSARAAPIQVLHIQSANMSRSTAKICKFPATAPPPAAGLGAVVAFYTAQARVIRPVFEEGGMLSFNMEAAAQKMGEPLKIATFKGRACQILLCARHCGTSAPPCSLLRRI